MGGRNSAILTGPEADFIKSSVCSNCVVIFSKSYCSYCRATKQLFERIGVTPLVYELDQRSDGSVMQDILTDMTGGSTVPRVFINGQCIGGNSETQKLHQSGKLRQLLQQCSRGER